MSIRKWRTLMLVLSITAIALFSNLVQAREDCYTEYYGVEYGYCECTGWQVSTCYNTCLYYRTCDGVTTEFSEPCTEDWVDYNCV